MILVWCDNTQKKIVYLNNALFKGDVGKGLASMQKCVHKSKETIEKAVILFNYIHF